MDSAIDNRKTPHTLGSERLPKLNEITKIEE